MAAAPREYFTVDLRGLRAALAARAARDGVTESDVLRSALAAALDTERGAFSASAIDSNSGLPGPVRLKLTIRLVQPAAHRLDQDARAAGLSRSAYLARLIRGAPGVATSADRVAMCQALNKSSEELALLCRELNHLISFLLRGSVEAAKAHAKTYQTLDRDVRSHLALAAPVLADLAAMR